MAAAREQDAARRAALVGLGATGTELEDAVVLLAREIEPDADETALNQAAERLKQRRPELFASAAPEDTRPSPLGQSGRRPRPLGGHPGTARPARPGHRSKRRVNAAKFRAYDAQAAVARRQAEKIITESMLPPLGHKLIVGELEQTLLDTARGSDSSQSVEFLYDDIERHVESIHNGMELAVGNLLVDGRFSLNGENGLTLEADFGVPAANMPTAANPWLGPDSDPIVDELRWIEYLRSIGAPLPARVLTSYKARATLAANDAYRAAYYGSVNGSTTASAVLAIQRGSPLR